MLTSKEELRKKFKSVLIHSNDIANDLIQVVNDELANQAHLIAVAAKENETKVAIDFANWVKFELSDNGLTTYDTVEEPKWIYYYEEVSKPTTTKELFELYKQEQLDEHRHNIL